MSSTTPIASLKTLPSVTQDQNRLLFGAMSRALAASVLLSVAMAGTLALPGFVGMNRVLAWLALVFAVSIYRLRTSRAYARSAHGAEDAVKWAEIFLGGAALAGFTWGVAAVTLFPADIVGQVFMAFTFAGVSAGSITTIGPNQKASTIFLSLTLLPLATKLMVAPDVVPNIMGWMTVVFLAYLVGSSRQISNVLEDNFKLRQAGALDEISLTRQRDLLERVGRMAAVGGWTYELDSGTLEWSREVFRIHGTDPGVPPDPERALEPYVGEARATIESVMGQAIAAGEPYDLELPFRSYDGRDLWVRVQGIPEQEDGKVVRLVGTFQDVTDRRRAKQALTDHLSALERLYHITSDGALDLDAKFEEILGLGLELFGLELAIVSRIEGDTYTVLAVRGDGDAPAAGSTFEVGETLCIDTLNADRPLSFHEAVPSDIRDHPCYRNIGLKAYIGSPIFVGGERMGTLNFSSATPRSAPFTSSDHAIVQVLAEWIGFETSRAQAIQSLEESEERVRLLLESVGDGVYGLDLQGRGTFVNPAALAILDYGAEDIIGKSLHDLVHHSHLDGSPYPVSDCPTHRTLKSGRVERSREILWRSDGSPVPTEMTSTPLRKDGEIVGAVVAFRDITQQEEYERRLMSILAMQRAILDSANYSIIATDVDGTVRMFSRGAERMLGYAANEVVGRTSPLLFHDPEEIATARADASGPDGADVGDVSEFGRILALSSLREEVDEREWTYVRKDGSHLPVLLSISAVRDDNDQFMGYLGIAADLTERKRVDRLKNEFVSTVSHELRTPLTSIRGSLGLVAAGAAGELPARAKTLIDIAARNSERLILLINDILDMEKIESGKMDIRLSTQPLVPIVEQVVLANQAFASEHRASIAFERPDEDSLVEVDENRLYQILTNLVSNASKFSRDDTTVTVAIERLGSQVRISVSDQGQGISDDFSTRIFEKFSQADGSDRRKKGGTGLGLSISRGLVERMNGRIGFDSEVGVGTTFWVEFPSMGRAEIPKSLRNSVN